MTILQGLKLIARYNLPHPEWEFVRNSYDLNRFYEVKDYVGWTIRTVEIDGMPWKNLYVNWLAKKELPDKLDEFAEELQGKALFVVYPSWKWKRGGTVLVELGRTTIEAVSGEIEKLMRGGKVGASYIYKNGKLVLSTGDKNLIEKKLRKEILKAEKIRKKNIILEWALTTKDKLIFYRVEDMSVAAQLLIEKYG